MSHAGVDAPDLLVIGGGSAGLVAARFAAKLGAKVVLAESERVGGDCTWTGCVPSKALLRAGRAARDARDAARFGVNVDGVAVDMNGVRAHVQGAIATVYASESPEVLAGEGILVTESAARFLDASHVEVGGRTLTPKHVVVCTGAEPRIPPIPGLAAVPYVTYESVFDLDRLPRTLVILGAGPIGLEMATAFSDLGSRVTVLAAEFLPEEEPEVQALVRELLVARGVHIVDGTASRAAVVDGGVLLESEAGPVRGDLLLVATGRAPRTESLGLAEAGIETLRGGVMVNDHLRSNLGHVYAAGDVTGGQQFTHYAAWQGFQAARNALLPGNDKGVSSNVPRVTYLHPEVASVGLTEHVAREEQSEDIVVAYWEMAHTDRAVTDGETAGFIKVVADADDEILGASIVATRAGEMISEMVLAMQHNMTLSELASTIHPYPTWSTGLQQVAADHAVERFQASFLGRVAKRFVGF